jgi:putative FmdB family regulatory protein
VPTYQYACTACSEQLEVVQKFTDDPLTACPACDGRLRKVFSAVGVVFKGSGFYRTDSRAVTNGGGKNGKSAEPSKNGSGASDAGSSSAASSSESTSGSSTTKDGATTASTPAA